MKSCQKCKAAGVPLERDHRIPKRQGGWDDPRNFHWLCLPCHRRKSELELRISVEGPDKYHAEWLEYAFPETGRILENIILLDYIDDWLLKIGKMSKEEHLADRWERASDIIRLLMNSDVSSADVHEYLARSRPSGKVAFRLPWNSLITT